MSSKNHCEPFSYGVGVLISREVSQNPFHHRSEKMRFFEADIDKLGATGVSRGCNPPVNDRFCPDEPVTREQMAAFIHRAVDYIT